MLMDIILYLLQLCHLLYQQNCWFISILFVQMRKIPLFKRIFRILTDKNMLLHTVGIGSLTLLSSPLHVLWLYFRLLLSKLRGRSR